MIDKIWTLIKRFITPSTELVETIFTPIGESNQELCVELLNALSQQIHNSYNPLRANSVFILSPGSNITEFVNVLKLINITIKAGRTVEPRDCDWSLESTTLDQFFVSKDGFYIESSKILELIEESQKLTDLMKGAEQAEYGVEEHNSRMLTKTFLSLKSILAALLLVLSD